MKNQAYGHSGSGAIKLLLLIALLFPFVASAAVISTVAGNGEGNAYFTDVYNGALATEVAARGALGIVTDADGNLYYNANTHVVKRDATTGLVTIIAGNGTFGFSGDGGAATSAAIQGLGVTGLGFDLSGNLLIADSYNSRMRAVNLTTGIIATPWGDPSTNGYVTDMEYDGGGTLFTVDTTNCQIWITPPSGPTSIFAGLTCAWPASPGFSGDGGPAAKAQLNHPYGLALDAAGDIYFSDSGNHVIRRIDRITGVITTYAGQGTASGFSGDGGPATAALLNRPGGIDFDSAGNLYIADGGNARVRRVDAVSGMITTVAGTGAVDQYGRLISSGDGGEATNAGLKGAGNVALDANDNLYIVDYHRIRKVAYADTTPPVGTVSINNGADFSTANVALSLTCDDGTGSGCARVQISVDGGAYGSLLPFESSIPAYFNPVEGVHSVTVRFEDGDRNASEASDTIIVDLTRPDFPIITSPPGGSVVGDTSFLVTGTAEPFVTLLIKQYDGSSSTLLATTTADAAGEWSATIGSFAEGSVTFRVASVDQAGNTWGVGTEGGVIIDTTPPATPVITVPVDGTTTTATTLTLQGTYSRTELEILLGTQTTITLLDGDTVVSTSTFPSVNWSFTLNSLSVGTHQFSVTSTDSVGNVSAASDVVTVTIEGADITPPVVTPPTDLSAPTLNAYGSYAIQSEIAAFLASASAVDNLDGNLPVSNDMPSHIPIGTTTVTFSATDAAGNTGSATATITLSDQTAPTFTVPPTDQTIAASSSSGVSSGVVVSYYNSIFASDNVDTGKTLGNGGITHDAPSNFPVGVTPLTFTATDVAGNSTAITVSVTVTFTDVTPPQIQNAHADSPLTVEATSADGRPLSEIMDVSRLYAWDDVDGRLPVTHDAPEILPIGVTVITFSAVDAAGNTASVSRTITITPMSGDTTAPVVTPPLSVTLAAVNAAGTPLSNAAVFLSGASATDEIDGALPVTHNAPDPLPLGATAITFSATDSAGNSANATAVITVTDQDSPLVTAPLNATLAAVNSSGTPLANAADFLAGASALDNVDGGLSVTNDAPDPLPLGSTTVTFSATDATGHTTMASAVVTVTDQNAPVVTPPMDVTLSAVDANGIASANALDFLNGATATDNVDGTLEASHNAPDPLPLGTTTVTFRATDAVGNAATATATVTVTDQLEPEITAGAGLVVLGDATLNGLDASAALIQGFLNGATAQDNVDGVVTVTHDAPSFFPYGSTSVTFSAVDAMGNTTAHDAVVTVNNPDATGDAAPATSGTGLTVGQSTALGLDPNAITTDTDGDGVDDNLEVGDPLNPSDADGDGVLDLFESGAAANDSSYVNGLATATGSVDLQSSGQRLAQVASSATGAGTPSGVAFPFGVISYESTVTAAGDSQTVRLTFSEPLPARLVLYKVDVAGVYTVIPASQWTQVNGNTVDLTLTDGGPFDLDGVANGVIVDPLALGGSTAELARSGGGGGGSASPWALLLLLLLVSRVRLCSVTRKNLG